MERISEVIDDDLESQEKLTQLAGLKSLKEIKEFLDKIDLKEGLKDANAEKLLCYGAAEDIKKNGKRSVFQSRTAMKLIPKIVNAAKFLVKYELI